jgi:16S rRNA processing protein RimM
VLDAFGIKGQVKLKTFTEQPENLLNYSDWILEVSGQTESSFRVSSSQLHGKFIVAVLEGIATRDEALALKGADVRLPISALPNLGTGEYYWFELIGLQAVDVNGAIYGTVEEMMETGANDVLVVHGETTHLIPYTPSVIREVSLQDGKITVDWFTDY